MRPADHGFDGAAKGLEQRWAGGDEAVGQELAASLTAKIEVRLLLEGERQARALRRLVVGETPQQGAHALEEVEPRHWVACFEARRLAEDLDG